MASDARLIATRRSLHGLAELVLAGPQHAQTGEITLRAVPGGFATTHTPDLRVEGTDVVGPTARVGIDGRSPAELAAALGVSATSLAAVYADGPGVEPDELLEVDADAAARIADAFASGDAALRALAPDQTPVLWPEHFDIGISVPRGQLRGLGRRHVPRGPLRLRRPLVAAAAGRLLERALRPRPPHGGDRRGPAGLLHRGPGPARRG